MAWNGVAYVEGAEVGDKVGTDKGASVGLLEGRNEGTFDGAAIGAFVGAMLGQKLGRGVSVVGWLDGTEVGCEGAYVGSERIDKVNRLTPSIIHGKKDQTSYNTFSRYVGWDWCRNSRGSP
jgi:hypothetical protein